MIDFLRANTWCSQEEYKWGMSIPQVRIASMDFTHIEYLSDKAKNGSAGGAITIEGEGDLSRFDSLGIPIINNDSK